MEKRYYNFIIKPQRGTIAKILILSILTSLYHSSFGIDYIDVWPYEISFNYVTGSSTNDALTIETDGDAITAPEWKHGDDKYPFAYIKGQSNRKIRIKFDSNCDSMHLLINATITNGTGFGEICNVFVANYNKRDEIELTFDGTVPNTVGKHTYVWLVWDIYGIPKDPAYCSHLRENYLTVLNYYVLYDTPVYPQQTPDTEVLDYACVWANGKSNADDVCTDILDNGFYEYYNWTGNCHKLSSDFLHLVSALGISASLHRWASKSEPWSINEMMSQRTKDFDPVGPANGYDEYEWGWHQWAEAASSQRDPSANVSLVGEWTDYEDDLFTHYKRKTSTSSIWEENEEGQEEGCEAECCRDYSTPSHLPFYGPDEA